MSKTLSLPFKILIHNMPHEVCAPKEQKFSVSNLERYFQTAVPILVFLIHDRIQDQDPYFQIRAKNPRSCEAENPGSSDPGSKEPLF